jgi:hypothetical protein
VAFVIDEFLKRNVLDFQTPYILDIAISIQSRRRKAQGIDNITLNSTRKEES